MPYHDHNTETAAAAAAAIAATEMEQLEAGAAHAARVQAGCTKNQITLVRDTLDSLFTEQHEETVPVKVLMARLEKEAADQVTVEQVDAILEVMSIENAVMVGSGQIYKI